MGAAACTSVSIRAPACLPPAGADDKDEIVDERRCPCAGAGNEPGEILVERPLADRGNLESVSLRSLFNPFPRREDIHKSGMYFITASALSKNITEEFDIIFSKSDKNLKGALDKADIEVLLEDLADKRVALSTFRVEEVFKKADTNCDGKIQRQEFHDWMHSECFARRDNLSKLLSDKTWLDDTTDRAFKSADTDRNGWIDSQEFHVYLAGVSQQLEEASNDSIYQVGGFVLPPLQLQDGMMSKEEFRKVVLTLIVELYILESSKATAKDALTASLNSRGVH